MTEVSHLFNTLKVAHFVQQPVDLHVVTAQLSLTPLDTILGVLTASLGPSTTSLQFFDLMTWYQLDPTSESPLQLTLLSNPIIWSRS